jgi:hypothetical protein
VTDDFNSVSVRADTITGDLIPASDARLAVALAYQRAADWLKTRLFWAPIDLSAEETAAWIAGGKVVVETCALGILALAPTGDLAEVQALRAERDNLLEQRNDQIRFKLDWWKRAEAAEAENALLREALMDIADPKRLTSHGDPGVLRDHARAALTAQGDAK